MTNIDKIRELLKQIQPLTVYPGGDLLKKALALLPCETCEGLEQITVPRIGTPGVDWEPCPDCKGDKKMNESKHASGTGMYKHSTDEVNEIKK